tara:strand:- start:76 stop:270 length:195 start_codon:yes stop_codon:yes gene_type:complete
MTKGLLWTAYGYNHEPLNGYQTLFAFDHDQATQRFKREYGDDSSILYLVADTFSQWEERNYSHR